MGAVEGNQRRAGSVLVRWRFHGDGSWSAALIAGGETQAEVCAPTGLELTAQVGEGLDGLARRWGCALEAVHDLEGDVRAFAVEGFAGGVCDRVPAPEPESVG